MFELALLIGLFIAVGIGVVLWRGRQIGALARHGVDVTGKVTRTFRSGSAGGAGSRGFRIEFEYVAPDGQRFTRYHTTTRGQSERWPVGADFELVCLPNDPGVSAERSMVDAARTALRKRGKL